MKTYYVRIVFDDSLIYDVEKVKAGSKRDAYTKAKQELALRLFRMSKLKNYTCFEQ